MYCREGLALPMTKKTKILTCCLAILLCAGLLAYGVFLRSTCFSTGQQDDSAKLAELEADLVNAASSRGARADESCEIKQTHSSRSPKARRT